MPKRAVTGALGAVSLLLAACTGSVSGGDPSENGGGDGGYNLGGVGARVLKPAPEEPRVVRLTHTQYVNSLQDLFGIQDDLSNTLPPDALNGFGFATSNDLRVDQRLGPQYRQIAESLSQRAVEDDAVFLRIVTCQPDQPSCVDTFLDSFGQRAFRRPLSAEEKTKYEALFEQGADLIGTGDDFRDGVQLTLEAMLQSPQFLYRAELGAQAGQDGRVTLSPYERAARLSFLIYDSMPDADLLSRAGQGQLETPEQIGQAVRRMLTQPRAVEKLVSFHEQAWEFGRFSRISPDTKVFPNVPGDIIGRVRNASQRFVQSVVESGGGLSDLLTAPYAFADSALAPFYGQNVSGDMKRIELSGGRKGFLMQVGYLASNAYAVKTDPIHRGLFVIRDLLCRTIPDPPAGAAQTPLPETDEPIITTRDEIGLLTGQSFCPTCHGQINPPGFAFEGFDAIGKVRTTDNGAPVDTTGEMVLDGQPVAFKGPGELVEALADSDEARACYAGRWLEFAYGRPLALDDVPLQDAMIAKDTSIEDLLTALATSPQFLTRKP
jgi:uncharacterized protein DUF1592/uncharacterized protein DUF1588/uncharacterized protein DUF1595/uncharacterized protein DUF1587/uncharacterized protein DUF1585